MGRLLDTVKAKLAAIRQELALPMPDAGIDPNAAVDAAQRRNSLRYLERQTSRQLVQALRALPREKQDEFYDRCIQENAKAQFSREEFHSSVDSADGLGSFLITDTSFGQSWEQTIGTLEEVLGEEAANQTADAVENVITPDDPAFPEQSQLRYPFQAQINEVKNEFTDAIPGAQQTRAFLDQVNEHLAAPTAEMSHFIDEQDHEVMPAVDKAMYHSIHRYMQGETGQKYMGKMPSIKYSSVDFELPSPETISSRNPLSADDVEEMKTIHPVIGEETKQELLDITGLMDELGEENFKNSLTTSSPSSGSEEKLFVSEQGTKNYAFWPLVRRRQALEAAVEVGNIAYIRTNDNNYMKAKETTDKMMDIVRKNPSRICSGNLNSTRTLGDQVSPIPLEYQKDFISHAKLNGVFMLYALSKNTGKSVKEVLEDPVKTMTDASQSYIQKYGLGSRKSNTDKVISALNENESNAFGRTWDSCYSMLAGRAFSGAAAMGRTEEERAQLTGVGQLAIAASTRPVKVQAELWGSLQEARDDKKKVMIQHGLLLDDDAFDPLAMAESLKKPSWKKDLSVSDLIDKMKAEGKLNVGRLTERIDDLLEKSAAVRQDIWEKNQRPLSLDRDGFDDAALSLGREVLRKATPEEKKSEDYIALQEKLDRLTVEKHADELLELEESLNQDLAVQAKEKKGFFLSSKNSEEHQYMTLSQQMVSWKLRMLRGGDMSDVAPDMQERLRKTALATLVNNSRELTLDYCAKKTDNGRKTSFSYDTGSERFTTARGSIDTLDDISELAETKTPAHRYMDELRTEALDNRHDKEWVKAHAVDHMAKCMYAMSVDFKHPDGSKQGKYLEENKIYQQSESFKKNAAVKQMQKKNDNDKLVDLMIQGKGNLTSTFIKAKNEVAKAKGKEQGKTYKEMSPEERGQTWAKLGPM